ncbi:transporter [Kitasatospora albolonga]|uniref:transporter n=1 Tax=Kitasatospora albolonga TaxID=68173 RepID=UPI0031E8AF70
MSAAVTPDAVVVRTLVRLKLRLLANGLRRSPGRRALYVIGSLAGLLLTALIATAFAFLHGHAGAGDAAVMLTTSMAIGWGALPLFLFSSDEAADPTRLTMLPLRPAAMLRGTLLGALIGPGPVIALVMLSGAAVAGSAGAVSVPFAVLGVPLTVLTLVTLSRAVAAGNAKLLSSRRGKDFAIFGGLLFALLIQVGNLVSQSILGKSGEKGLDLSPLEPFAAVLRWIPPVSALDAGRTAGESVPLALLQLAATAALLVLLLRWWRRSLVDLMVTADSSTLITTRQVGRSTRDFFPEGRVGAVMQRHLRYAWREPRAKAAVFTSIGMTLVMCVLSMVQGWATVYLVSFTGMMLGLQMVNLFGMDGSAFWMVSATLAGPADARDELRGRAYGVLSYAVPVTVVLSLVLAVVTGKWSEWPPALGLALAGLGAGVGAGALLSVLAPFALPADSNPMRNAAPGQGGLVMLNTFGSMLLAALIASPVALLMLVLPEWTVLPGGLLYGALFAVLGTRLAAARLLERLPEILATAIER